MFNRTAFENSRPDGFPVLEIVPLEGTEAAGRLFVPLRHTELSGEVCGPLAALTLTQAFAYSREQCDRVLEALYRFPLPGDAAVTGVRVRFGDTEIDAALKERGAAEKEYADARAEGRQAALTTRESPDVFTLHVTGLQPDQEVVVTTSYVQLARAEGPGWSLRVPLTTSPRYVRGDEAGSRHADGQPLALLRDPGHRFTFDLVVRPAGTVRCATHRLDITGMDDGVRVRLSEGEVMPDRDLLLCWETRREPERPVISILLHSDLDSANVYFLALVTPPGSPPEVVAREAILLVDHSGSMHGAKWEAADWAVKQFLSGLEERDGFALGLFHNTCRWYAKAVQPANSERIAAAVRFLEKHQDSGGTDLGVALEQALHLDRTSGERSRHLLVVTDAEVTDAARILRLADEERSREDRRRVSVLCIDAAPNAFLAQELAERGGGVAHFLTSDPEEDDIATALDEVLSDWSAPVYAGLRLELNRAKCEAGGRHMENGAEEGWSAIDLGDLPGDRSVWIVGRVPRGETDLSFRLAARGRALSTCDIPLSAASSRPEIKALFGARRLIALEYLRESYSQDEIAEQLRRLGYEDSDFPAPDAARPRLYRENEQDEARNALTALLVREALEYGLASSETAFVAVRKEAGRLVEATLVVANALPHGWDPMFSTHAAGGSIGVVADRIYEAGPASMVTPAGAPVLARARSVLRKMTKRTPGAPVKSAGTVFSGRPAFADGEAILFDSVSSAALPEQGTLTSVTLQFPEGAPAPGALDSQLALWIFVDDLAAPRARVAVADLLRQGGRRPLNLDWDPGRRVRVTLLDPRGAWLSTPPNLEVILTW